MKAIKDVWLLSTLHFLLIAASSQGVASQFIINNQSGCTYIDNEKPTIFISYNGKEESKTGAKKKNKLEIVLRLHNNSSCTVIVETAEIEGEQRDLLYRKEVTHLPDKTVTRFIPNPLEGARLPVHYDIQEKEGKLPKPGNYWRGSDLQFTYPVPPGLSVTFAVDAKHFEKGYNISVPFSYEWEKSPELRTIGTIEHRVYYAYDLPKGYYKE